MNITEINFRMASPDEPMLIAFASCVIDGRLYLNNIAIRRKYDGSIFLNFPRYTTRSGNEFPYYKPINHQTYNDIKSALLDALTIEGIQT